MVPDMSHQLTAFLSPTAPPTCTVVHTSLPIPAAVTYCLVICKNGHDGCYVHSTLITVSAILFIVEHVFWSPSYHLSFPVSCFTPITPLPYPPASPLLSRISLPSLSLSLPPLILIGPQAHQTEGGDAANSGRCQAHSSIGQGYATLYVNYRCCGILSRLNWQYNSVQHHTLTWILGTQCVLSV